MNSKYMIYSILTTLVIVGIYQIFALGRYNYPEFRLKSGQIAEMEVIAPFDFPVLKSATDLSTEQEKVVSGMRKPYEISEEIMFEALSTLDNIFGVMFHNEGITDANFISAELKKEGINITGEALTSVMRPSSRDKLYEKLRTRLGNLYRTGIYDKLTGDSILIFQGDKLKMEALGRFINVEQAGKTLADTAGEHSLIVNELAPYLLKPNLVVSESKYNELSQRKIASVPPSEGVVLQNEVIVRKNARITPEDIRKLESLQDAYRNRNLRKSPLQELLLALGLGLFVFMVVSLANHYFGVHSKEDKIPVADFLPINAGFVMLVLFSVASNHLLAYNNMLIPLAMTAIAATILISFEFGVLYSVCNLLVISPFTNWETFTPVVLILSTLMCLILIRRQNAYHEYLLIWLYLAASLILASLSIAIYKNDPLSSIIRSVGMGLISATISVGGVLLIVPYYERKWNRATKQTMLELLDFNHPLLKRLATEAVGTYHHSLVVGNLSERAAEAIGANSLLARVGSYYHDVGKIINTDIFTENNEDSTEIHSGMSSSESAQLIRNHVQEGIILARKYRIPQPVIDIIMQHHGNSLVKYFYDKAVHMSPDVNRSDYQYQGPKPQSKEAALVMLADIVESTTNAKQVSNVEEIQKIIDDTINRLFREEQFSEAPITLKDLRIAKESMLPVLESIHRKRLDYPDSKSNE